VKYACENDVSATVESRSTVFKLTGRQLLFGTKTQVTARTGRIIVSAGDITISKINHEHARARQRGREAARDDPEFALHRLAGGSRVERSKFRLVICPGCWRERYLVIAPTERRRARCTECGVIVDLEGRAPR
jgi:hypothetical protein